MPSLLTYGNRTVDFTNRHQIMSCNRELCARSCVDFQLNIETQIAVNRLKQKFIMKGNRGCFMVDILL